MELKSSAFGQNEPIPRTYSRDGEDASPPLEWSSVPDNVQSFALICEDPDAPQEEPWTHWVIANIPSDKRRLDKGESAGTEGQNDFGERGYGGPMPPPGHGTHHYHFRLYALDTDLDVGNDPSKKDVERALQNHVLDQVELVGTFER